MKKSTKKTRVTSAQRAKTEARKGYFKLAGAAVVIAAGGATYLAVSRSNIPLDEVTLCPAQPSDIVTLVVDMTDPLNVAQRQDFKNQLTALRNSIPRYGQLAVFKVDAVGENLIQPVIVRCNPGTAADVSEATGNPKATQKLHDQQFVEPLDRAFTEIMQATAAGQSPIFESVQSVALTELNSPNAKTAKRKIILVSDLLQNTSDISFYRSIPERQSFIESNAFRRVRTDLNQIEMELWVLERGDAADTQPNSLIHLWNYAVQEQGGSVLRSYRISG